VVGWKRLEAGATVPTSRIRGARRGRYRPWRGAARKAASRGEARGRLRRCASRHELRAGGGVGRCISALLVANVSAVHRFRERRTLVPTGGTA